MWASSRGLAVALTSTAAFRSTAVIAFLLVSKKTANTRDCQVAFGHNGDVELVGPPVPECSNCQEPRGGGVFSDDGDVYLCPKCLAFHDEYRKIMAEISADRERRSQNDSGEDGSPV